MIILVVVVLVVLLVLLMVAARSGRGTDLVGSQLASRPVHPGQRAASLDPALRIEVLQLLGRRRRVQAVKLLVDRLGLTLTEAKAVVDDVDLSAQPAQTWWLPRVVDLPPQEIDELRALVRGGRKIEAIKVMRERTGLGLADAKRAVERL